MMKEDLDFFRNVLAQMRSSSGDCADIFQEKREDFRYTLSTSSDPVPSFGLTEGAALRLMRSGYCSHVHLESPRKDDFTSAVKILREDAAFSERSGRSNHRFRKQSSDPERTSKIQGNFIPDVLSLAHGIRDLLKEIFRETFSFSLSASFYRQKIEVLNCMDDFVEDCREAALFKVAVSLKHDNDRIPFELSYGFPSIEKMLGELHAQDIRGELVRLYRRKKNAVRAPEGMLPLVMAPGAGGIFFHEVAGHLFEADSRFMARHVSELKKYDFGRELTIYDDPSLMERGRYEFDDEGVKSRRKALIENGRFANLLHSILTARNSLTEPLGNGRRQSFREIPLARSSALVVEPGKADQESILKNVSKGLYAMKFGDAFFDESSLDFYIHVTEGNLIENGSIGAPIEKAIIRGNVLEVFRSIDMIGNDLSFDASGLVCSKAGQALPSSVGAPTTRIASIHVLPL